MAQSAQAKRRPHPIPHGSLNAQRMPVITITIDHDAYHFNKLLSVMELEVMAGVLLASPALGDDL